MVTTHQVEGVQNVLTDLMFINHGRILLVCSMEEFETRYVELAANPEQLAAARALKPIYERQAFGPAFCFRFRAEREKLAALGEVHAPSIADVFVAVMGGANGVGQGAGR